MLQTNSLLNVSDNSGGKLVKFINKYGSNNKKAAGIGDFIIVSVRGYVPLDKQKTLINLKRKILLGQVHKAVIVRTVKWRHRESDSISFSDNAVVLMKNNNTFLFSRIFGPVARELRDKGWGKLILLSELVL